MTTFSTFFTASSPDTSFSASGSHLDCLSTQYSLVQTTQDPTCGYDTSLIDFDASGDLEIKVNSAFAQITVCLKATTLGN